MRNAQPTTNSAKWILKVDYLSISKQQKKFGVSEMQGSGTGNPTTRLYHHVSLYFSLSCFFIAINVRKRYAYINWVVF